MELYQLKAFIAVAQERSITRASERLHLSQPAISAQIKAMEDMLGITLFERTARGMTLTGAGQRILVKAQQTLSTYRELIEEARHVSGRLVGKLRLGALGSANAELMASFLEEFSRECSEVEVSFQQCTSLSPLVAIRNGDLDAGFFDDTGEPIDDLFTIEVARFWICLVAPAELTIAYPGDVEALVELPWIYPTTVPCYDKAAASFFHTLQLRPKRIISVDTEDMARTLLTKGIGLGLLRENTALEAQALGQVRVVRRAAGPVRVLFAHLLKREQEPLLREAVSMLCASIERLGAGERPGGKRISGFMEAVNMGERVVGALGGTEG